MMSALLSNGQYRITPFPDGKRFLSYSLALGDQTEFLKSDWLSVTGTIVSLHAKHVALHII